MPWSCLRQFFESLVQKMTVCGVVRQSQWQTISQKNMVQIMVATSSLFGTGNFVNVTCLSEEINVPSMSIPGEVWGHAGKQGKPVSDWLSWHIIL